SLLEDRRFEADCPSNISCEIQLAIIEPTEVEDARIRLRRAREVGPFAGAVPNEHTQDNLGYAMVSQRSWQRVCSGNDRSSAFDQARCDEVAPGDDVTEKHAGRQHPAVASRRSMESLASSRSRFAASASPIATNRLEEMRAFLSVSVARSRCLRAA